MFILWLSGLYESKPASEPAGESNGSAADVKPSFTADSAFSQSTDARTYRGQPFWFRIFMSTTGHLY